MPKENKQESPETPAESNEARADNAHESGQGARTETAPVVDPGAVDKMVQDAVRAETARCVEIRRRCNVAGLDSYNFV